jgi:hypothetical protein
MTDFKSMTAEDAEDAESAEKTNNLRSSWSPLRLCDLCGEVFPQAATI